MAIPRVLSEVVHDDHRSGHLISAVPGRHMAAVPWSDLRTGYRQILGALAARPGQLELPPPQTWCGGERWLSVVQGRLGPLLGEHLPAALSTVEAVLGLPSYETTLVHGDFGHHNILWDDTEPVALIDFDHASRGDPAIDHAPLVGLHGAAAVADIASDDLIVRAMIHRASLPLQVAAAAELAGRAALRDHALGNFVDQARAGTLHDPGGARPS